MRHKLCSECCAIKVIQSNMYTVIHTCVNNHKFYDINTFPMQRVNIHTVKSIQSYTYRLVAIKSIHNIQAMQ